VAALTVVLLCGFTCVSATPQSNKNIVPPSPSTSPTPPPSPTQASTPASITGIPMPGGEVGIAYASTLGASGGASPYTWSLDSGALPGGLTLGSDGGVSGVPTAAGTFNFTVKASDATNQYTTQGATIKIAAHLTAALIPACAQACYVEQGCVNVCGAFGSQSGGVGPFNYSASGNIPGGMKLSGLSLAGSFPPSLSSGSSTSALQTRWAPPPASARSSTSTSTSRWLPGRRARATTSSAVQRGDGLIPGVPRAALQLSEQSW